jgi:hypothetical protein
MNKKCSLKYSQVRSCFNGFIVRNSMLQSEFSSDTQFMKYIFFKFHFILHVYDLKRVMVMTLLSHSMTLSLLYLHKFVDVTWYLMYDTPHRDWPEDDPGFLSFLLNIMSCYVFCICGTLFNVMTLPRPALGQRHGLRCIISTYYLYKNIY